MCVPLWMCVPSPECWHCAILCSVLFWSTVLWSLCGLLGNCSGVLSLWVTCVGVSTAFYMCCPLWEDCLTIVSNIGLLCTVSLSFMWFPFFGLSVNVKFRNGIKRFSLSFKVDYVHYFVHWAKRVSLVNDMLGECRSVVWIFKVVIMFAVPHTEGTACLTCVYLMACEIFKLVNSIFLVFVWFFYILWC